MENNSSVFEPPKSDVETQPKLVNVAVEQVNLWKRFLT